jgi:hypothetical protein
MQKCNIILILNLKGIFLHLNDKSPNIQLFSLKGLLVAFFKHIPDNIFVFVITVTVHGGAKPPS